MDIWTASEVSYKNGYAKGCKDGKRDAEVEITYCLNCVSRGSKSNARGKVWCNKMCRYMKENGFCSEGKDKE